MLNNSSKIMFIFILILGTVITISSNSWMSAWMGLEINLLSFIPLMSDNNLMSTEASLKYFLTQALASAILLFSFILMNLSMNFEIYSIFMNKMIELNLEKMMIISSLLLKVGAAPFHFWFPNIIEGLSWINSFILMTWQKIAPLMLLSYLSMNNLFITCAILSVMFGSLGGLNQTSLRKLMVYSSINHLGWMISLLLLNEISWMMYFLFYSFLSFNMIYLFNLWKIFHLNQMFSMFFFSKTLKFTLLFNLLSLGGLPPFLGFIPKWISIDLLTSSNYLMITFILISFTLITLFFYLRICYSGFMLNHYESLFMNKNQLSNFNMNLYLTLSSISFLGLPIISLLYLY